MKQKSKVNLKQVLDVGTKSEKIGNTCYDEFVKSNKLEHAKVGISAFRNVLYANSLVIKSEKL